MSNRTDYRKLMKELAKLFRLRPNAQERIEAELHNAHGAGAEGGQCQCRWCDRDEGREVIVP